MPRYLISPTSYIYICTRLTVRKGLLISNEQYIRLLNMDLIEIIRFIGETKYQTEIDKFSGSLSGIELIETALTRNLADTYREITTIAPSSLKEIAKRYLLRWDIWNIMLVLRSIQFDIPSNQILNVIVPAGSISEQKVAQLLSLRSLSGVIDSLKDWIFYSILMSYLKDGYQKGVFSKVENALYISYYETVYRDARSGIKGGDIILPYLRLEIDITNIKNLFRLRSGTKTEMISQYIIPGGNLQPDYFQRLYTVEENQQFIAEIQKSNNLSMLTYALQEVRNDTSISEMDAANYFWIRWERREKPQYSIIMAVQRYRLQRLDDIARRHQFSILPILSYLEHKRYEVNNLRTIARGKQFGLEPNQIKKYLNI